MRHSIQDWNPTCHWVLDRWACWTMSYPRPQWTLAQLFLWESLSKKFFWGLRLLGKKQRRCWVLTMEGKRSRWIGCEGLWTSSHGQMCIVQTAWFLHQTNFIWYFKIASIWLEDEFPFGKVSWQVRAVSVRGCAPPHNSMEPKPHQFWQWLYCSIKTFSFEFRTKCSMLYRFFSSKNT